MADRPQNEKLNHFQGCKMAAKETICLEEEGGGTCQQTVCIISSNISLFRRLAY